MADDYVSKRQQAKIDAENAETLELLKKAAVDKKVDRSTLKEIAKRCKEPTTVEEVKDNMINPVRRYLGRTEIP